MIILDQLFNVRKADYDLADTHELSIIIKTFNRKNNLERLLSSLQRLKCACPIIVADDSPENYKEEILEEFSKLNITYLVLPFDTGLSEGRNIMLSKVTTPFFVLCDDDFIFDKRSRLNWMKQMLVQNNLDILGGVFFEYRPKTKLQWRSYQLKYRLIKNKDLVFPAMTLYNYYGKYEIEGENCYIKRPDYLSPVTSCDFCHNFFVGKTESVKRIGGWKKELKVGEHENFFVKAKLAGLKIATTQEAGIIHGNFFDNADEYFTHRRRAIAFQKNSLSEFGIKNMIGYEEAMGFAFAE